VVFYLLSQPFADITTDSVIETNLYSVSPIAPVPAILSLDQEEEKINEICCCYEKGFDAQEEDEMKETKFSAGLSNELFSVLTVATTAIFQGRLSALVLLCPVCRNLET